MKNIPLSQRLRYKFDNLMSSGPVALILALFLASTGLILVVSLLVVLFRIGPEDGTALSFGEAAWMSLMRTLDAGTMGGDSGWGLRFAMLVITFGGIFVVSMLIGVMTTGIEGKLEDLRKGRSFVVETNHVVILGWSEQVFSILSELIEANANQKRGCIAILADKDKVEMEDLIRSRLPDTRTTRIVCRTGSPINILDLQIVNPQEARSIIVLSPEVDNPDTYVIKAILALNNLGSAQPLHIVAEIRKKDNVEAARLVAGANTHLILADDLVARITAQTCRLSGLSIVYTELLDFGGDEIYFSQQPGLTGKTFGEALLAFEDSTLIGVRNAAGPVRLNPPMETPLAPGDTLIVISADDDTVRLSSLAQPPIDREAIRQPVPVHTEPEQTLILGWNHTAPAIIRELDNYVAPGSSLSVVANTEELPPGLEPGSLPLTHQQVTFQQGDTTHRSLLDSLNVPGYDHVILLSYSDEMGAQEADAITLITLLHLRDIGERLGHPFSIVSQMLDVRNRELAEVTRADDFIVSDKIVSLVLSQVSENNELEAVFTDLFDPEGSELYLKPAAWYVAPGTPVNFYTVVAAARCRGEVAIGYRLKALADQPEKAYGVKVNPKKSEKVTFSPEDRVIVLAEE